MKLFCWHKYEFYRKRIEYWNNPFLIFVQGPHFSKRYLEDKCIKCGKVKKRKATDKEYYSEELKGVEEYDCWR